MEQFFASLSKRQTMLLLTSLAFGGSQAVLAYEHLTIEDEELLKHRAAALLQIPRDKRIPLLVQEIKRLITARRKQLAFAEPKRLASILAGERPALIEVVLGALPVELADALRAELPPRPPVTLRRDVKPDVLSIVRWKLEDALKAGAPQLGLFRFTDLLTLQQREVLAVCDRMGARVLATAVAGLPDADREAFLTKLPPDQRALAARAAEAGKVKRLSGDDARTVLEMHGALENPSVGLRSAGVQRLARACIAQSPEFAQRMVERHPGELGKLLVRWIREERPKPIKGDGGRMDIVEQLERLAQKGVVDRPMRLPPPVRPPPKPIPPRQPTGQRAVLDPQEIRSAAGRDSQEVRSSGQPRRQSVVAVPTQPPPQRRDPIAEREARRAGAAGTSRPVAGVHRRVEGDELPELSVRRRDSEKPSPNVRQAASGDDSAPKTLPPRPPSSPKKPAAREGTDPRLPKRIMRDGKPLVREPGAPAKTPPPRKATASPSLVDVPRRRDRTDPHQRSPVLKGPGGGAKGRGPNT